MRRIIIHLTVIAIALGCRSAAVRGADNGCEDGEREGTKAAFEARRTCSPPSPFGCTPGPKLLRKQKYDNAYSEAWDECFQEAYTANWTEDDYRSCRPDSADTGHSGR